MADEELEMGTVDEPQPVQAVGPRVDYLTYRHQYPDVGENQRFKWEGEDYQNVSAVRLAGGSRNRMYDKQTQTWNDWETDDYTGGWKIVTATYMDSVVISNKEDITALRGLLNLIEDQFNLEA